MPVPVWGSGNSVLWSEDEALLVFGGSGVGKTTLAGLLVHALIFGGNVLGLPVSPAQGNVLFLAMDRPKQAARSLRRQFEDEDRAEVEAKLKIWQGPPPADFARNTDLLRDMCRHAGASHVVVDSLKDAALGLKEDEVGASYNRARQAAIVDGVQVLELHHSSKTRGDGPRGIDSAYGSTWLTTGTGSVIHLDGNPGDPVVKFRHLKQPISEVGPFNILHDPIRGMLSIENESTPIELIRSKGQVTVAEFAAMTFSTSKPSAAEVQRAKRVLEKMLANSELVRSERASANGGKPTYVYSVNGAE